MEQTLSVKLPAPYVRFLTVYPFPDLAYMRSADFIEFYEMEVPIILDANENLRDKTLNPFPWREEWFAIGERGDDAVFYLDCEQAARQERLLRIEPAEAARPAPVYLLEPGAESGLEIAGDFTEWAQTQVAALVARDAACIEWHARQKPGLLPFPLRRRKQG